MSGYRVSMGRSADQLKVDDSVAEICGYRDVFAKTGSKKKPGLCYQRRPDSKRKPYFLLAHLRSFSVRCFLRRRVDLGVTSSSSSSSIYSSACSRVTFIGATRPMTSSLPEARRLSSLWP